MAATFRPASPAIMACWIESRKILWTSLRDRVDSGRSSRNACTSLADRSRRRRLPSPWVTCLAMNR
jgi:hypothetical protein